MGEMVNEIYDCDMIIVQAPYGHGLYSMTYPVREEMKCPAWMVADPPDETVWKEINWQLDHTHEKNASLRNRRSAWDRRGTRLLFWRAKRSCGEI